MKQSTQFLAFLESMTTEANSELMECIKSGFALIESEDDVENYITQVEADIVSSIDLDDARVYDKDVEDGETIFDMIYDLNIQPMIDKAPAEFRDELATHMLEYDDVLSEYRVPEENDETVQDEKINIHRNEETNDIHLELTWKVARPNGFGRRNMARDVGMY